MYLFAYMYFGFILHLFLNLLICFVYFYFILLYSPQSSVWELLATSKSPYLHVLRAMTKICWRLRSLPSLGPLSLPSGPWGPPNLKMFRWWKSRGRGCRNAGVWCRSVGAFCVAQVLILQFTTILYGECNWAVLQN